MSSLAHSPLVFIAPAVIGALGSLAAAAAILRSPKRLDGTLYKISAPAAKNNPEQLFQALHGILPSLWQRLRYGTPWMSFELSGADGRAMFYLWIPRRIEPMVRALLAGNYGGCELVAVSDPLAVAAPAQAAASFDLFSGSFLPIGTDFDGDSLASLLAVLASMRGDSRLHLSLAIRPRPNGWQARARALAERLRSGRANLLYELIFGRIENPAPNRGAVEEAKEIERKASASAAFDCSLRLWSSAPNQQQARAQLGMVSAALRVFNAANSFAMRPVRRVESFLTAMQARAFPWGSFLLTPAELQGLWHLPVTVLPHTDVVQSPRLAPPADLPRGEGRTIGTADYPGHEMPVVLTVEDGRRHSLTLASTGGGKSTLIEHQAIQEAKAGRGFALLDPQGSAATRLLGLLPLHRGKDVVLLSPDSTDRSLVLNPLEWKDASERYLLVDNLVAVFKALYQVSFGQRTEWLMRNVLLALTAQRSDASLMDFIPFLTNPSFRAEVLRGVTDPMILEFVGWYEHLSESQRIEAISPILNRIGGLLSNPVVRRLLCGRRSTFDLRGLMDNHGILIADLSTGRWGDAARIIGAVLLMRMWQAGQSRAAIPESERVDFAVFVDEWQRFIAVPETFADALARGRAYKLSINLYNQSLTQLPKELREAVTANTRSRIIMQVGQDDAKYLASEFAPLDAEALMNLPRYHAAVRLSVDGETSRPFTMALQPPLTGEDPAQARSVAEQALHRFGRSVVEIDAELERSISAPDGTPRPAGRRPRR